VSVHLTLTIALLAAPPASPTARRASSHFSQAAGLQASGAPAGLERALGQFDAGRYAGAASTLESLIGADTRNAEAYYWLGRARFELRQYARAVEAFTHAADLRPQASPQASEDHRWLGRAYGEQADASHSFSLARRSRQQFEEAVRLAPSSIAARRDLMEFYLEAPGILGGGEDKARGQAEAIAGLDPIAGHLARAAIWSHRHDAEGIARAKAEYRAALDAAPPDTGPYFEAAEFYVKQNDVEGLRAALAGASRAAAAVRQAESGFFRGVLDIIAGDKPMEAEASLKEYLQDVPARSDRPSHAAAHEWLGRLYESEHRPDLAAAEYREALRLEPERKGARARLEKLK
jgi:tetratricopeptide (TPR) repeat protein